MTLPPIPGVTTHHWSPKNYDGGAAGTITLRRALENSKNLVTARLLDGAIDKDPRRSLRTGLRARRRRRASTSECMKNYPFVLGAQALRMIDLAGFYAAIANEGVRVDALFDRLRSSRTAAPSIATSRRRRRISPTATVPRSISSAPSSKAWCRAAPRPR